MSHDSVMDWLLFLLDIFLPGFGREDGSYVGKSRMDRQALWIARILITLLLIGVAAYFIFFR